jgi:2-polyprenyl-6-methoxyphenol hydroxylase-like FAD-dependent oxidoreductase
MSRQAFLDILVHRALDLGVEVAFQCEVLDLSHLADADLVVLADGAGGRVRRSMASRFGTTEVVGTNKHIWLGTSKPFEDFTFAFEQTSAGWIWFHAYRHGPSESTLIVECPPETWRRLGFDAIGGDGALERIRRIFARHLDGHTLRNRPHAYHVTQWSDFAAISNKKWYDDNVVLLGDAAHTTHFSVGSGTRLALEDAMALSTALTERPSIALAERLEIYQRNRLPEVCAVQAKAARSAAWFERFDQHARRLAPIDLGYSLRTRRGVLTWNAAEELHRPYLPYLMHLATQRRFGRSARRAVSKLRRRYERPRARYDHSSEEAIT